MIVSSFDRKQRAYTLIEVLVAMAIGIFLMGGVAQLFSGMSASVRLQEQVAFLQENGRLAIELLAKDIRNADYWGCSSLDNVGSVIDPNGVGYSEDLHGTPMFASGIRGTNDDGLNGSDIIILRGTSGVGDVEVESHNINAATIAVSGNDVHKIQENQVLMVSNCESADIFQVTNEPTNQNNQVNHNTGATAPGNEATYNQGTPGRCTNCFKNSYADSGAFILMPYVMVFYLDEGASGLPALFLRNTSNCPAGCELIEGVENMQILYGEDTTFHSDETLAADRYVPAGTAGLDMQNVVSVKVSLLVRTEQPVASDDQAVTYNGGTITYDDGHLRKVYSSTISIRNRMQRKND